MTDKKLEKEAEEYLEDKFCEDVCTCDEAEECKRGIRIRCMSFDLKKTLIINFVEPREKKIVELEKENAALKEKYEKGKELVERMKNVYLRVTDKSGYEGIKEEQEIEDFIKE